MSFRWTLIGILAVGLTMPACQLSPPSQASPTPSTVPTPSPHPTSSPTLWLTPTPPYDESERAQVHSFCLDLQAWYATEAELVAENNAFQEQVESGNITAEMREKPSQLYDSAMSLYNRARDMSRPVPARPSHDKLLDFASTLEQQFLALSNLSEQYSDDLYAEYVSKSQATDRAYYALVDETQDLFNVFEIDPSDCTLVFRSHYPLLQTYSEREGWYPGPNPGMVHRNIETPSYIQLTVEETDDLYAASFSYVYGTATPEQLQEGINHIEEVLRYLLKDDTDVSIIVGQLPETITSFTGEQVTRDMKVSGLPSRIQISPLDSAGSLVQVAVIISK